MNWANGHPARTGEDRHEHAEEGDEAAEDRGADAVRAEDLLRAAEPVGAEAEARGPAVEARVAQRGADAVAARRRRRSPPAVAARMTPGEREPPRRRRERGADHERGLAGQRHAEPLGQDQEADHDVAEVLHQVQDRLRHPCRPRRPFCPGAARAVYSGAMPNPTTTLLDARAFDRTLRRMADEIVELNDGTDNLVIVGIQRRGVQLAAQIVSRDRRAREGRRAARRARHHALSRRPADRRPAPGRRARRDLPSDIDGQARRDRRRRALHRPHDARRARRARRLRPAGAHRARGARSTAADASCRSSPTSSARRSPSPIVAARRRAASTSSTARTAWSSLRAGTARDALARQGSARARAAERRADPA